MVSERPLKNCLIVFAKSPESGKVKTRLCPPLSHEDACRVYRALLRYTLDEIHCLKRVRKVISYTGSLEFLKKTSPYSFEWIPQANGGFGKRLEHASLWSQKQGSLSTVIIGSDAYIDAGKRIMEAFEKLKNYDLVIGPAWDGGFYLLGFRNGLHTDFFKLIRWSSSQTLRDTLSQFKRYSYKSAVLPMEYDVDDENGLKILKMELKGKNNPSSRTRRLFRDLQFTEDVLK